MGWELITDLPDDWPSLVSTELDSLAEAWQSTYQTLKDKTMVDIFNERLRREWSIETGIIERLYTINLGTTRLLIEQGIHSALFDSDSTDRPVGEVIQIIKAQREALDGLYDFVAQSQKLSVHYIRTLHQVLLRNQEFVEGQDQFGNPTITPLIKGTWKNQVNSTERFDGTIFEYCPPEHVQSEMERLVAMHNQHYDQKVSPQVEAAWLHHRFVQIHPFQDGNGRVARCLATLVLIQAGRFPLVINRNHRNEYVDALREADNGNLVELVRLFDQIQKRAYIQALDLSENVLTTQYPVSDLIESITNRYKERQQTQYDRVFEVAKQLRDFARETLEEYAEDMRSKFRQSGLPVTVRVSTSNNQNEYWYRGEIVETAKKLQYFANLTRSKLWVRLRMEDNISPTNAEIVVSLHYLGKENRGVMIATAFLNILHPSEELSDTEIDSVSARNFRETHTIVTDGFTFAHTEIGKEAQIKQEFHTWLEQAIVVGLAEWQKQL